MTRYRLVLLLSFGHLATDINQGALPAILPFLISEYKLTYSAGASIIFAANSASAVVQPLFGYLADRISRNWLLPLAILLAGLGIGSIGFAGSYGLIIVLAVISGVGIAAFHPQAARLVNFAAGGKKGTSMSFFGLGGILGFAIGPVLATVALAAVGLKGTIVLFIPVFVAFLLFSSQLPKFNQLEKIKLQSGSNGNQRKRKDQWFSFSLLSLIIMGRSTIFFGFNTFIPLYWTGHFNRSMVEGGLALSTVVVSGVFGNIVGGWISDRIGFKKTIILGFFGLAVLLPVFISIENPFIGLVFLVPIGFMLTATYSPTIVLGQEYLPNHVGFSSGITLGISVAFGGIAAPFIGMIADSRGIWWSLAVLTLFPVINGFLSLLLPGVAEPENG
jgi:MFS transporter, FSR family, fosmidomycin resistance protein